MSLSPDLPGPSLLGLTLHLAWSIGMNLSPDLLHTPSTATSHPTPAHHKPRATSHATMLSISHHIKGVNLPWFLTSHFYDRIGKGYSGPATFRWLALILWHMSHS